MNSFGKNLTGERKGTFTQLDVSGQLNIDNDGSFFSSGNILSSGSISASHADFEELYANRFYCNQGSINHMEFDSHWAYKAEIVNLSVMNACFTTLNDVNQKTFAYIGSLSSDAQVQINNVSTLALNTSNTVNNLSGVVSNVSSLTRSAYNVANTAFNLVNNLSYTVDSVSLYGIC